jgi:hypothetical protein
MRDAYREIYESCHMKYGLAAPFTERFFDLAQEGTRDRSAGYVGLIVANSFMKREFGKKLIERVLPRLDLTHLVDCSGAHIPGHGTPTVILFGRNRTPVDHMVRTVRSVRSEPSAPADPAKGAVWSAIVAQVDLATSASDFISTEDTPRDALARHPWNMGGGGAADIQESIERSATQVLGQVVDGMGFCGITGEDEAYILPNSARLQAMHPFITFGIGDEVRDFRHASATRIQFPYTMRSGVAESAQLECSPRVGQWFWPFRTTLRNRLMFGKTPEQAGQTWWEYRFLSQDRLLAPFLLIFAFVATHNHFVLDRGGKVFKQSAPVIKLPSSSSENDHLGLLGLLNSSVACFWIKQVCHNKGSQGINEGAKAEAWERFIEVTGTRLELFPLISERPLDLARAIDTAALRLSDCLPGALCTRTVPTREAIDIARAEADATRSRMITLQEELDWRCYRLYGLLEEEPEHPDPPPLRLGERAFEIAMARHIEAGDLKTAWFERHRSTPITDLPRHWPADYRAIVERRIALIESDPTIGLIERPEYKRRWSARAWDEMERDALRTWLLDRLEDPRFWPASEPRILSAVSLADLARHDTDFLSVAELYAGRAGVDLATMFIQFNRRASEIAPRASIAQG